MPVSKDDIKRYAIRLGDDAVVLGHRLSEWCSFGPFLEEDLALTNVALDFIGRARMFYAMRLSWRTTAPPRTPTPIPATTANSPTC